LTEPAPTEASSDARPGELPGGDESFVEEELPADFWGEEPPVEPTARSDAAEGEALAAAKAKGSGRAPVRGGSTVTGEPGADGVPASGTVAGFSAKEGTVADPAIEGTVAAAAAIEGEAFATLQLLFPGKVVSIESPTDAGDVTDEGSDTGSAADEPGEPSDPDAEG
jgi:hypothetical protein